MHTIDYTQSAKNILFQLINAQNGTQLSPQDFEVSLPIVSSLVNNPKINTSVKLTPLAGTGYYGERTIYYSRIDLTETFGEMPFNFYPTVETQLYEILSVINETYGLFLKEEDIYDVAIPPIDTFDPTRPRLVNIVAKAESFFFTGNYTFSFTPLNSNPVGVDGVERVFHTLIDGLPFSSVKDSFIALNANGEKLGSFNFLGNATPVSITIDKVYKRFNGEFYLVGNFSLSYTDQNNTTVNLTNVKTLRIAVNGYVIGSLNTPVYESAKQYYHHPKVSYRYLIDEDNNQNTSRLYRYDDAGLLDTSYRPNLPYVPQLIRVTEANKVYTVSKVFTGPDLFSNNLPAPQIRIDRLLQNGELDSTFQTVYIRASQPNLQPLPILDLVISEYGGFFLAVNPLYTTDKNAVHPIVNGRSILENAPNLDTTFSWNPVLRFTASGSLDWQFNPVIPFARDRAIYETTGSPLVSNSNLLVPNNNQVLFMTYRKNPITGYEHVQPIAFNANGEVILLSGLAYLNQYKWTALKNVIAQSNGYVIAYGLLQTQLPGGGYSAPYSALVRYHHTGAIERILWRSEGPSEGSNPTIKDVAMTEVSI